MKNFDFFILFIKSSQDWRRSIYRVMRPFIIQIVDFQKIGYLPFIEMTEPNPSIFKKIT